jgi:hypothetical protein
MLTDPQSGLDDIGLAGHALRGAETENGYVSACVEPDGLWNRHCCLIGGVGRQREQASQWAIKGRSRHSSRVMRLGAPFTNCVATFPTWACTRVPMRDIFVDFRRRQRREDVCGVALCQLDPFRIFFSRRR